MELTKEHIIELINLAENINNYFMEKPGDKFIAYERCLFQPGKQFCIEISTVENNKKSIYWNGDNYFDGVYYWHKDKPSEFNKCKEHLQQILKDLQNGK